MATPSRWDLQRARHRSRRGSRIRRRRNKRSPKSMRLIDADVVTTDSVSFGRIGDFENSSAPRRRQGTCGYWTIYVDDQHRRLLLRSAKRVAARVERKHQWPAETVLSEGHRLVGALTSLSEQSGSPAQQTTP